MSSMLPELGSLLKRMEWTTKPLVNVCGNEGIGLWGPYDFQSVQEVLNDHCALS